MSAFTATPYRRTLDDRLDAEFPPMRAAPVPRRIAGGYEIDGIARVLTQQPRNRLKRAAAARHAAEFAERIATDPDAYLPVLLSYKVPGIIDLRPHR